MTEAGGSSDVTGQQRRFYAETACAYEGMHERLPHQRAVDLAIVFMRSLGVESVLDTGCGTGLATVALADALPGARIHGNDPSPELLAVAQSHGIPAENLDCVASEELPYESGSFDVVIEVGVLHHVPEPAKVLSEMMRVARLAVFLSDDNFFGSGRMPARIAKLGLWRLGLLPAVTRLRRGGHLWRESAEDGITWDYSIFWGAAYLSDLGADVHMIPTAGSSRGFLRRGCPLIFATHGLVVALKR